METTLKQLFTTTSKQYGNNIAITYYKGVLSYQSITYHELNQEAQKISHILTCLYKKENNTHNNINICSNEDDPQRKMSSHEKLFSAMNSKVDEDKNGVQWNFHGTKSSDTNGKVPSIPFSGNVNTEPDFKDTEFEKYSFKDSHSDMNTEENKSNYEVAQHSECLHRNKNDFLCKRKVVCVIGYYSPGTIACILGIMDSFAFMYLSADYTATEMNSLIEKVAPKYLLIHENVGNIPERFHEMLKENISVLNENFDIIHLDNYKCNYSTNMIPREISYVITTSGSTGVPKIVYVPSKCILPNISDFVNLFNVNQTDAIFCASPLTFDPSIVDLFLAFSTGAQVVLVPSDVLRKPDYLLKVLCKSKTSILQTTPTLLFSMNRHNMDKNLLSDTTHLRVVALGGEQFPYISTLKNLIAKSCKVRFFNLYGITEVSCWASVEEIFLNEGKLIDECLDKGFRDNRKEDKYKDREEYKEDSTSVPIGSPLFDTVVKVFDSERRELNEGEEGELFIGGKDRVCFIIEDGKNNSAYNFPEFNDNSSIIFKNLILRATGDIGVIKDGKIFYFGRKDSVVKRNGQKVALYEICKKCESIFYILSSFCIVIENFIVLFVLPVFKILEIKVREDLRNILAAWKMPDDIVIVNEIPYDRHGKLNKVKLTEIWNDNIINRNKESKKFKLRDFVFHCWYVHTGCNPTSTSNFINDGGTSFSAVQFTQKIEDYLDYQIHGFLETVLMKKFEELMHELISNTKSKVERQNTEDSNPKKKLRKSQENNMLHNDQKSLKIVDNMLALQKENENSLETIITLSRRGVHGIKPIFTKEFPKKLSVHWTYDLGKCIDSSPIIVEYSCGKILSFVGSHSHKLACVDVKTGCEMWCLTLSDRIESSPTVSKYGRLCYVGCYGGSFYCIDIDTGDIVWIYIADGDVKSSPCVDLETSDIFFGSHDKKLHCVTAKGNLKWKTNISGGSIFSSPCIDGNCIFTATLDGSVACLNKHTGEKIWQHSVSKPVFSSIALFARGIIIGCVSGEIFAYKRSGELIWKQKVAGPIFSSPYVHNISHDDDIISIGTHCKKVLFLNSNGDIIVTYNTNSPVYATPFLIPVSARMILCIICDTSGHLSVLKLSINSNDVNLCLIVEDDLPGEVFASPVMHQEYLLVGCRDDKLYCYKIY
ncbi:unnamed protein product [Meganyctiphanes norvegica]|uniref:Uncharacterized protein n=1 Tax=Meganyctiphanes norvegica TaxID=48144 RepID=A0AAV2PUL5_MEGNR